MRRINTAPKISEIEKKAPNVDNWFKTATDRFSVYTGAAAPTAAEVPEGQWVVYKNTTTGETMLYTTDGGVLKIFGPTYETGTFVPRIYGSTTAGSPIYASRLGRYTKIGNRVFGTIYIVISNKSTMAGQVRIDGLPYTLSSLTESRPSLNIGYMNDLNLASNIPIFALGITDSFQMFKQAITGNPTSLLATEIAATFGIYATFAYETGS